MKIFTIGHSTRTINKLIEILITNRIRYLVDVRSYPASTYVPEFNKDNLKLKLAKYILDTLHTRVASM